ncbi:hypothetical protein MRB53_034834 [Persea americana]|uniref:Uncharacterized protein n=1 Tax=Persea americana TaxID=3435 RepID=A0ACC2K2Y3_PERAE|nr:hypothetical protein MRB53_034834 [Persea americana]
MGRSPCCEKAHTNKGAWTKEEDQRLISYIKAHGEGCWRSLPKAAGLLRCGKSCRLRWINYLRPDLKRGNFTEEEDELIIKLHSLLGNKWSLIAGRLPGRTDNEIKNYWNTHIKRKLQSRGLDPQTHLPIGESTQSNVSNSPPQLNSSSTPEIALFRSDNAAEDANSSGVSEVVEQQHHHQQQPIDLNLDLSISLPFKSDPPSANAAESKQLFLGGEAFESAGVCLCCHLGFQRSEACCCRSVSDVHALRYYSPVDL